MKRRCSKVPIEICILAGGLSSRMGRDKSKLLLGGKTLLSHVRKSAKSSGFSVRVIRRDLVPRCGPLGGIYTGLKTSSADAVLFLACDMPKVSAALLEQVIDLSRKGSAPVFTWHEGVAGFPFLLNGRAMPVVAESLEAKDFSLQNLVRKLRAKKFRPGTEFQSDLLNVNTPADWGELKGFFAKKQ